MGKVRKRVCGRRRSGNLGNPLFSNSCPGKISSGQCVQMSSTANKTICPDDFCSSKMDQNLIRKLTKNGKIKIISSKLAIVGGRGQCTCVKSKHFLLHLLYGPHTATRVIMIPLLAYCHHMSRRCIAPQQQHLGTVRPRIIVCVTRWAQSDDDRVSHQLASQQDNHQSFVLGNWKWYGCHQIGKCSAHSTTLWNYSLVACYADEAGIALIEYFEQR